jgi:hypothetical protein
MSSLTHAAGKRLVRLSCDLLSYYFCSPGDLGALLMSSPQAHPCARTALLESTPWQQV